MEFTLLWAALTAFAAAWVGTRLWKDDLPESPIDQLITAAIAGLLVGRLAAMIGQGVNPITNLSDFLIVRGGVSTWAATIAFGTILYLLVGRRLTNLDTNTPTVLLGLAGWHSGCLWRDACLGTASNLPWAYAQPGSAVTRHPVELYAALALGLAAWALHRTSWPPGQRLAIGLVAAAGIRLATEPLRLSLTDGAYFTYSLGLVAAIALWGLARPGRRSPT